jgi:hypothetical protein
MGGGNVMQGAMKNPTSEVLEDLGGQKGCSFGYANTAKVSFSLLAETHP